MFGFNQLFNGNGEGNSFSADVMRPPKNLNEFFDKHYYPHCKATIKTHRHTLLTYEKHFRDGLGFVPLKDLDNMILNRWVREQIGSGFKYSTINKHIFLVNRLLGTARNWGVIPDIQFYNLKLKKLPTGDYRQRFLSQDEMHRLVAECDKVNHPYLALFVQFLLLTGSRKGEARNARWQDIDFQNRVWRVPVSKNGRSRRIMLSSGAVATLDRIRDTSVELRLPVGQNDYLFINPKTRTCYHSFHAAFFKARDAAGLSDVRIHDLRHTFASVLINRGVSLYEVQELLGHSNAQMTQRYAHLQPNELQRRTEIMGQLMFGIG
jgi:integrase